MELILYGLIGSVLSLIGGVVVLWQRERVKKVMTPLLAFAAAAFLGVSFLDLLPEAVEVVAEPHYVFIAFLVGVTIFFALERALMKYFYKHPHDHSHETGDDEHTEYLPALVILGDSLHNFLDGIAIAIAFVANPALGLTTALAVTAHEIPHEIGDFAILLDRGWSSKKVFLANLLSSLTTFIGIGIGYVTVVAVEGWLPYLLAGVAGIFSYIALSDLIPEVHHRAGHHQLFKVLVPFVVGLVLIGYLITTTH
ncbi:MAG: ZIP family metal transporter [Patescibacteria group bacterium]